MHNDVLHLANMNAADTGARLGRALFAYMLGVTLIITLVPFHFAAPSAPRLGFAAEPVDMVANVLLFVPLGFFYALARPAALRSTLRAVAVCSLVSVAIECLQYFEPARTPSPVDVMTNTIGAVCGAVAASRVARAAPVGGHLVGWLALELPLMGLMYLLVPLLWIDALSSGREAARAVLAPLLGVFGALLIGGMQRHYFAPTQGIEPHRTAALAALWFVAGAFPALAAKPLGVMLGIAVATAVCWFRGRARAGAGAPNRRFEVPLLRSAAPIYALYCALLVLLPLRHELGPWTLRPGFSDAAVIRSEILHLLELVAAASVAGYMLAEFRGRELARYPDAVPRLLAYGVAAALAVEVLWGFRAGHGASIARAALMVGSALYGGWLYYLQRAHVVRLLAQSRAADAAQN